MKYTGVEAETCIQSILCASRGELKKRKFAHVCSIQTQAGLGRCPQGWRQNQTGQATLLALLVAALSGSKSYEFKALFSVVHAALRARNAASGGEEMLRLRTYDKLQNLVRQGQVKKTGKKYKGVANALLLLSESLKEFRKNGPSFSPRPSLARQ